MATMNLRVNGRAVSVNVDDPDQPLLYALEHDLALNGPKFGCGLEQCGACTVLVNGEPRRSCTLPMSEAAGKDVMTIEGLGTVRNPHPIQQAFIAEQAIQCGFCVSGPMLYGKAAIDKNPNITRDEIVKALDGIMCRCHAQYRMLNALERYAATVRQGGAR